MPARLALLALLIATPAAAQLTAPRVGGCVDVSSARAKTVVTARGMLARKVFPGPPNFESVAKGDAPEPGFVLTLPAATCADDRGDGFTDRAKQFREIQVWADDRRVTAQLRAAAGRRVTLTGTAMPAQTGHHQRPLVLAVAAVRR